MNQVSLDGVTTVLKPTEIRVASRTQKTANALATRSLTGTARVIMIDGQSIISGRLLADQTNAVLSGEQSIVVRLFKSVLETKVRLARPSTHSRTDHWVFSSTSCVGREARVTPRRRLNVLIRFALATESVLSVPHSIFRSVVSGIFPAFGPSFFDGLHSSILPMIDLPS
jgi:hypothetical protein